MCVCVWSVCARVYVCLGWEGVGQAQKEDLEANVLAPVSEILTRGLGMGRATVSHPWEA